MLKLNGPRMQVCACAVLALACARANAQTYTVTVLDQQWTASYSHHVLQPPNPDVTDAISQSQSAPDAHLWSYTSPIQAAAGGSMSEVKYFAGTQRIPQFNQFGFEADARTQGQSVTLDTAISGTSTETLSLRFQLTSPGLIRMTGQVSAGYSTLASQNQLDLATETRSAMFRLFDQNENLLFELSSASTGVNVDSHDLIGIAPFLQTGIYRMEAVVSNSWDISGAVGHSSSRARVNVVLSPSPGSAGVLGIGALRSVRRRRR